MIDKNLDVLVDEKIAEKKDYKPKNLYENNLKIMKKTQEKIESMRKKSKLKGTKK